MYRLVKRLLICIVCITLLVSTGGVFAYWSYLHLDVEGDGVISVSMELDKSVYIIHAEHVAEKGAGTIEIVGYNGTYLNSVATLNKTKSTYTTATITVYNNALETYAFNAVKYHTDKYSNVDIVYELPVLKHGDQVAPGGTLEFEVVFEYKPGVNPSNYVLTSLLNFEFTPLDELPEEEVIAVSGALGQFQNILNNVTAENSLSQLLTQMDKADANDRHDGSYIGNVGGASASDVKLLEDLFQGNLTININGQDTEVTILIKRENIDGDMTTGDSTGREMTIYLTTDTLEQKGSFFNPSSAIVYAAVFTSDDEGEDWYQVGTMFEGEATIKQYNGWPGSGSFDTDTWETTDGKKIEDLV